MFTHVHIHPSRGADGDISPELLKAMAFIKFLEWALASLPEEFHYSGRYAHSVYMRFRIHLRMCVLSFLSFFC